MTFVRVSILRRLYWAAFGLLFLAASASAQSLVSRYVAGDDYHVASTPAAPAADGKIHVVEFFLYTCPHCYHFEPELEAWQKKLPPDVVFSRVPVLFGAGGELYARLYYTEEKLGVLDTMHDEVFDEIHQHGNPLATRAAMRQFMISHGISGARFDSAFDSAQVKQQVGAVVARMQRFQVVAVPSMGVAGRYWISGQTAGTNERMLQVASYLIQQARQRR